MRRYIGGFVMVASVGLLAYSARGGPESKARLFGNVMTPVAVSEAVTGSVWLIVRGAGDISDDCADAARREFVAEYFGELELSPDGTFEAKLVPAEPPVATPTGCPVTSLDVERVGPIAIAAEIPELALEGTGWLTFQTLTAVDNDDLQAGAFDDLAATLVLEPRRDGAP